MDESIIRVLCERMSALETMVKMHLDAEWKFWAFFATLAGGLLVAIIQNHLIQKSIKNGNEKK
jgi:hypothetical protein